MQAGIFLKKSGIDLIEYFINLDIFDQNLLSNNQ